MLKNQNMFPIKIINKVAFNASSTTDFIHFYYLWQYTVHSASTFLIHHTFLLD